MVSMPSAHTCTIYESWTTHSPGCIIMSLSPSDWFVSGFCLFFTRFRALHQWFRHKYLAEASHTKRSRRWERLQWFSALKRRKTEDFAQNQDFDRFWPRSAISLFTPLKSSDLMSIRWDDIENLSGNLHNTPRPPPKPKGSSRRGCFTP